jgi:hypothetical protein
VKTALITGASGGIGLELARIFSREGYRIVLVARNAARLEELKKELSPAPVEVVVKDLSQDSAPKEVFDALRKKDIAVDVLVNNAGVGAYGLFAETPLASQEALVRLNMLSLTQMTHLFLRPMLERRQGKVLNVASTAAFQPGPLMAVYYASKAYVLSFSEALANEVAGSGVTVSVLCPGPTATDFQQNANMGGSKLFKRHMRSAREVAEAGYRGLMKNKTLVVPGWDNKLLAASVRFAPRWLPPIIARKIQEVEK